MSTEERIMALEEGLAATQRDFIVHIGELNLRMATLNKVITAQELHSREIDHNLTILLGIASGQEHAIQLMQGDLNVVKADLGYVKERVEEQEQDIRVMKDDVGIVKNDLGYVKERVEQIVQLLTTLATKLE